MATTITANNKKVTIENIFNANAFDALDLLDSIKDTIWNTGLNAIETGDALKIDENPFVAKHIAAVKLFKNNSYVLLAPGDKFEITTKSAEETIYYTSLKSDLIKVTAADVAAAGA